MKPLSLSVNPNWAGHRYLPRQHASPAKASLMRAVLTPKVGSDCGISTDCYFVTGTMEAYSGGRHSRSWVPEMGGIGGSRDKSPTQVDRPIKA